MRLVPATLPKRAPKSCLAREPKIQKTNGKYDQKGDAWCVRRRWRGNSQVPAPAHPLSGFAFTVVHLRFEVHSSCSVRVRRDSISAHARNGL